MTVLIGVYSNVLPGDPAFCLNSNFCKRFEIGTRDGEDLWLEGLQVDGDFIFNGRLFLPDGSFGTLIDSFPKGPVSAPGWEQVRRLDVEGFSLVRKDGETIFAYRIDRGICTVDVNLHSKDGRLVVHGGQSGLVVNFPTVLG
jgi:hypothetical protein